MVTYVLWSVVVWTLKGLLCTWRFFWVNPYYAIKSPPWIKHETAGDPGKLYKQGKTHPHERSSALHKRLLNAEGEIQDLKAQIASQRASWEMRFMDLQRRQHDLRDQLHSEIVVRSSAFHKVTDSEEMSEAFSETGLENGHHFEEKEHDCSSGLNQIQQLRGPDMRLLRDGVYSNSLTCGQGTFSTAVDSRSTSAMSVSTSAGSWRSGTGPHRVFVPHSPMDLQAGHRVRILLPSGRISTGTLRYLGQLQGMPDIHLGVELELAENGQQTGTYEGQCYFECKPGHGAFVAFSKLLMAWE
ncbi:uncharacterized protein [Salminus brasiliensis]|uniref:uncharacterized protein isoform X2 n=1 Tax=Salminus brasiliensis TaxID=930266 RepID=UPI003B834F3A